MFDTLSNRLGNVFDRLKRRGSLSAGDVEEAMRDIRIALLEADVALPVVKDFIASVKDKAVGQEVLKSITPGQMVVKIVNDHLVELLGGETAELNLDGSPPQVLLMVGLQGSGKTTTSAKIAHRLKTKERNKVLLASLDVRIVLTARRPGSARRWSSNSLDASRRSLRPALAGAALSLWRPLSGEHSR